MRIKPIKTEADYQAALIEIDKLMDAELNTPEGDRLDILATLATSFEKKNYPIEEPDPIEAILHRLEAMNLTRKDLEPILGTRSRVSEILTRKRPLTLSMIRRIHETLKIPAEVLIKSYRLQSNI